MQSARATWDGSEGGTVPGDQREYVQQLYERIGHVLEAGQQMLDQAGPKSKRLVQLLSDALRRIGAVQRAFSGTGLDACLEQGSDFFETRSVEILFETAVATKEIQWRLRDIARDLSLHAAALDVAETDLLQPLITLLDGDPSQLHRA
jgi:hypothetical protein